jgi:RNA polymerase sigma factor (sigma-70 family)
MATWMYRRIRSLDPDDLVGVAQLALVEAVDKYHRYAGVMPVETFLGRCIRFCLIDYVREQRGRMFRPILVSIDGAKDNNDRLQLQDTRRSFEAELIQRQRADAAQAFINRTCDTRIRKLFEMRAAGLSQRAIGQSLGIHQTRVGQLVAETRRRLAAVA